MVRHLLRDDDVTSQEQQEIFALAENMKRKPYSYQPFAGPQGVAVLFDKTSSRTRFSFDLGIAQLGGHSMVVSSQGTQMGHSESLADTARVLSRYVSMIVWRTYAQAGLEEMAHYASVPVINALSDEFHPCQVLTDLFTIYEHKGSLTGKSLTYIGDGTNNMTHSLILGCLLAGINITVATPPSLLPDTLVYQQAQKIALSTNSTLHIEHDPYVAVKNADIIYTDTWVSMGYDQQQAQQRLAALHDYQVNRQLISYAPADAIVMHCLPAHRNEEITDEILDSPQSVVFDQAENRLHVQKAIMTWLIEKNKLS